MIQFEFFHRVSCFRTSLIWWFSVLCKLWRLRVNQIKVRLTCYRYAKNGRDFYQLSVVIYYSLRSCLVCLKFNWLWRWWCGQNKMDWKEMPQRPSHILEVHSLAATIVLTLVHHTALPDFRNCCICIQQMHAELYVSRKFLSTTSRGIFTHFQPFSFWMKFGKAEMEYISTWIITHWLLWWTLNYVRKAHWAIMPGGA